MVDLATAVTAVDACGRANVPALLLGDPGIGKSSVVRGLAKTQDVACEIVIGSIREPADIGGLPLVRGDEDYVLVPGRWAKRLRDAGMGYLFLDELTTCPPTVQAAMLSVVLDKTVGDLVLPDGVRVVAGANPPGTAAGGYELEPPMANRFCHIPFTPSSDEWLDGMTSGWSQLPASKAVTADEASRTAARTAVLGFIRTTPGALDGLKDTKQPSGPWASRRTWDMLTRVLAHVRGDDNAARQALVFGLIGEGAGLAFLEWCAAVDLPDTAAVLADPSIVDWTDPREDRVWAVLSGVASWAALRGTVEAWRSAWGPIVAAAKAGRVDLAGAVARVLDQSRPARATLPSEVRAFKPVMEAAGLLKGAAA